MAGDLTGFMEQLADLAITNTERAIALLFAHRCLDQEASFSAHELDSELHSKGFPKQNLSRLREGLQNDRRTAKVAGNKFCIRPTALKDLDARYGALVTGRPTPKSNSVLPLTLVRSTRGYIEKVTSQLNASYDYSLYDCCAVMCRRLLETLIIETYEHRGTADLLKNPDGDYRMFSGLLGVVESDRSLSLGRNSLQGLKDFKKLGDLSAHNRRFNAQQDDIDRVRDGLRVAVEEFVHLAGFR